MVIEHTDGSLFGVRVDQVLKINKVADHDIQPAPAMITARIAADYIEGVVVAENAHQTGSAAEDVILLLSLQNIITKEVVSAVALAADQGAAKDEGAPEDNQHNQEEHS
jgi:chemotaxis signal transduction protein